MTTELIRFLVEGYRVAREGTTLERLQWVERVERVLDALSEGAIAPRAGTDIAEAILEKLTYGQG